MKLGSSIDKLVGQNLTIQSQNMIDYLRFFIRISGFWENQTYKLSCIYNQNKAYIYNKIHKGN